MIDFDYCSDIFKVEEIKFVFECLIMLIEDVILFFDCVIDEFVFFLDFEKEMFLKWVFGN